MTKQSGCKLSPAQERGIRMDAYSNDWSAKQLREALATAKKEIRDFYGFKVSSKH